MRGFIVFIFVLIGTFIIDQGIKDWAVGTAYTVAESNPVHAVPITEESLIGTTLIKGNYADLELHFNRGVAFSMLAFLGPYMKWVQAGLVLLLLFIIYKEKYLERYAFPAGLLIGGAIGNVYDRFMHIGVVDYVAWHYKFNYAVFNYADVAIDVAFVIIVLMVFVFPQKSKY